MRAAWLLCALAPAALALASCDAAAPDEQPAAAQVSAQERPVEALPGAFTSAEPSSEQLAVRDDPDCGAVAHAYVSAIERRQFELAAEFWNDPVIDGERLDALFADYVTPRIEIADLQQEGAAGSLFCTITGALVDASNPGVAPRPGEMVLRRANDVPGATAEQLRWTIRSSTFVEPMQRSGKGEPA